MLMVTCSTAFMTATLIPQENEKQHRRDNAIPLFLSPDEPPNVMNESLNIAALLSQSRYTWHYTHSHVILTIFSYLITQSTIDQCLSHIYHMILLMTPCTHIYVVKNFAQ